MVYDQLSSSVIDEAVRNEDVLSALLFLAVSLEKKLISWFCPSVGQYSNEEFSTQKKISLKAKKTKTDFWSIAGRVRTD